LAEAQVNEQRLEQAFAQVPRENFLGPGPWVIPRWVGPQAYDRGYRPTPTADPVYLYIDNVVQIIAEPRLNNGQPSGHARWIASASIKQGEHVVHIGAGTGYYTAIMSHLVGPSGQVRYRAEKRNSRLLADKIVGGSMTGFDADICHCIHGLQSRNDFAGSEWLNLELVISRLGDHSRNGFARGVTDIERFRKARCNPPLECRIALGDCWFSDRRCC
jgi:hypothetical protein